jgi:hypothetical protein
MATALKGSVGSVGSGSSVYLRQGETVWRSKPSGGRPRQNLTGEQEKERLTPFLEQAAARGRAGGGPGVSRLGSSRAGARSITRWSTGRCLARDGAPWRRARSTPRPTKKPAPPLKNLPALVSEPVAAPTGPGLPGLSCCRTKRVSGGSAIHDAAGSRPGCGRKLAAKSFGNTRRPAPPSAGTTTRGTRWCSPPCRLRR